MEPSDANAPSAKPPAGEPARSLRISIVEGVVSSLHSILTSGALLTAYALMLGADDFHLGLLAAFGTIASIGGVAGSRLMPHVQARKTLVFWCPGASRLLWVTLCLLPWLPFGRTAQLNLFLGVALISGVVMQTGVVAWLSWMTDLVPPERRGRYFSIRNSICGAVSMVATYAVGWAYDRLKHTAGPALVFVPFYAASAVFALLASLLYRRQWEPPMHGETPVPLRESLALPLGNPSFRKLMIFSVAWGLTCAVAGPFFMPHMIRNLNMPLSVIAIYSVLAGTLTLVTQPAWGRVIDRVGNRPVLTFNIVGVATLPLFWLFARPDFLWPIWIDAILTGVFWPGLNLATFNLVLSTAPRENRSVYLAMHALISGAAQFAASLMGGMLAHALSGMHCEVAGLALINFHVLFFASALGRFAVLPLARRLDEDRAGSVATLITLAGDKALQWVNAGMQIGVEALQKLKDSAERGGK